MKNLVSFHAVWGAIFSKRVPNEVLRFTNIHRYNNVIDIIRSALEEQIPNEI